MNYHLKMGEETASIEVDVRDSNRLQFLIDQKTYDVRYVYVSDNQLNLEVDGFVFNAFVTDTLEGKQIVINGKTYFIEDLDAKKTASKKSTGSRNIPDTVTPVTPSVVVSVLVNVGDSVEKGQGLIVLSAMKMEVTLYAPYGGTITAIHAAANDKVSPGDILIDIEINDGAEDPET